MSQTLNKTLFFAIFQHYFVTLGCPTVHDKFSANCVTNGLFMAKKRFDLSINPLELQQKVVKQLITFGPMQNVMSKF